MANYRGGNCLRSCMLFYTVLFWVTGFVILFVGIWMITDPKRKYILDLVDFSEDDPLLRFAAYISIGAGIGTLFVGFLSCCGAIRAEKCMLATFIIFLFFIFLAEVTVGLLAVFYREKFTGDRMQVYVANMSHNRYYRDKWVTPLLDTIQYYQQCCGGQGPWDYYNSFWYITNTVRGTRSFVPASCCRQTQNARAWALQPIDPMCTTYFYDIQAFNASVNVQGCYARLQQWFDEQAIIFAGIGLGFATFQIVGFFIALALFSRISDYRYIS